MKNFKNLIYLIIFIFHQLKCFNVLSDEPYYKNIQLIKEDQFGNYYIIDDDDLNINILKFYLEKISLSYTSLNYQKINLFFF